MSKRAIQGGISFIGILFLILDSRTALSGASEAIELCLHSVIPSIFPFLVLSGILTSALNGANIAFLQPLGSLLGIPKGSEGIFLTGILGGYPTGAQAVHRAWKQEGLDKDDARRMLTFCSNAGPSFLFGILGAKFEHGWTLWLLWVIHILSAMIVAIILPGKRNIRRKTLPSPPLSLTQSLKQAVVTMGIICGWVVLFRVILAFLDRWILWLLPTSARIVIYGILELANGCCRLDEVNSEGLRFILCSGMLAFGGVCVVMQTASVAGDLGIGRYLQGKALQTVLSVALSAMIQWFFFSSDNKLVIPPLFMLIFAVFILFLILIVGKIKNRGSIPDIIGV